MMSLSGIATIDERREHGEFIALDFDGTLFPYPGKGEFPKIPDPDVISSKVIEVALKRQKQGAKLILWTCRSGKHLVEALNRCCEQGLFFDAINENPFYPDEQQSRKMYATIYVDDKAPGSIDHFINVYENYRDTTIVE